MIHYLSLIIFLIFIVTIIVIASLCSLPKDCTKYTYIIAKPSNTQIITKTCYNICLNAKRQRYQCDPYTCYQKVTLFTEVNNTDNCNYYQMSTNIDSLTSYSNITIYNIYYNTSHACFLEQNNNLSKCNYLDNLFIGSMWSFISLVLLFGSTCCYMRLCNIKNTMHEVSSDIQMV